MFFFKPKQHEEELLPPPPPFSDVLDIVHEEPAEEKSEFFNDVIKRKSPEQDFPEIKDSNDLMMELDKEAMPKKGIGKKGALTSKKNFKKSGKVIKKIEAPELEYDIKIKDFEMPERSEKQKEEQELPETLEDFDAGNFSIENLENDLKQESVSPDGILDAKNEIKDAIDKIKKTDKVPFFRRILPGKEKSMEKNLEEQPLKQQFPETKVFLVHGKLDDARSALAKFDLKSAKSDYLEIMRIYNSMGHEEQVKVYNDIKELYFERKSAEGLKV